VFTEDAALRLGEDKEFVTRLVEWSACEEHPGVKGTTINIEGAFALRYDIVDCTCKFQPI